MKKLIAFLFLPLLCYAAQFDDQTTGLTFEIPPGFELNEKESGVDETEGSWWYVFHNGEEGILTLEIDQYDHLKSLPEHFHLALTEDEAELEGVVFEGMEFKNIECAGREFTKCKLRILAIFDEYIEPLYVYDYLFVDQNFGFSISLMKKEEESETMILSLLESINFKK